MPSTPCCSCMIKVLASTHASNLWTYFSQEKHTKSRSLYSKVERLALSKCRSDQLQ
ncbi:hypothetical protein MtrunA17_Chr8g0352071 [Medicago truncatula]|uniref:Uncharacterized protein n=1 Tax=Medicago truncatula TaxID=3880 RepID=A0A396GIL2_MEDTR|nr:hypothetical protein MtrunA17_Chr8g0352071 [Medicago truncatula]